jgi:hypothetical protein
VSVSQAKQSFSSTLQSIVNGHPGRPIVVFVVGWLLAVVTGSGDVVVEVVEVVAVVVVVVVMVAVAVVVVKAAGVTKLVLVTGRAGVVTTATSCPITRFPLMVMRIPSKKMAMVANAAASASDMVNMT